MRAPSRHDGHPERASPGALWLAAVALALGLSLAGLGAGAPATGGARAVWTDLR